jgi:LPS export ABC transporter protein LptC
VSQTKYKKPKKLKLILMAIVLTVVSIVIVVYMGYRRLSNVPDVLLSSIQDGADMSIGRIHQTATRDGKREWSLEASSAQYSQSKKEVTLNDLAVTFFLEDDTEVYLTGKSGILNTSTNNIEVSGNVVIKKDNYQLTTEKLNYAHDQRLIFSTVPVLIAGDDAHISANSASLDLNTKKLRLEGNVESTISENIEL